MNIEQAAPEEIAHLDFEPEQEPDPVHHKHPTVPGAHWCGKPRKSSFGWMHSNGELGKFDQTCPECLRLIEAFGMSWYWETHRKHFGTNCCSLKGVVYHECGV